MEQMTLKQSKLMPAIWPSAPKKNGLCLTCDKNRRELFSWFCSDECERQYIDEQYVKIGKDNGI